MMMVMVMIIPLHCELPIYRSLGVTKKNFCYNFFYLLQHVITVNLKIIGLKFRKIVTKGGAGPLPGPECMYVGPLTDDVLLKGSWPGVRADFFLDFFIFFSLFGGQGPGQGPNIPISLDFVYTVPGKVRLPRLCLVAFSELWVGLASV